MRDDLIEGLDDYTLPAPAEPLAVVGPGGRLPLDRRTLEALAELFVGLLDIAEPKSDAEPVGDEDDGNFDEDDFAKHYGGAPGCPISDPGGGNVEDEAQADEGDCEHVRRYGIDQTKPTGPDNPEAA